MKIHIEFLPPDISLTCFKHEGLKIEAFISVIKAPYVKVSYEDNLVIHSCNTTNEAKRLVDHLIYEYMNDIQAVEDFFNEL